MFMTWKPRAFLVDLPQDLAITIKSTKTKLIPPTHGPDNRPLHWVTRHEFISISLCPKLLMQKNSILYSTVQNSIIKFNSLSQQWMYSVCTWHETDIYHSTKLWLPLDSPQNNTSNRLQAPNTHLTAWSGKYKVTFTSLSLACTDSVCWKLKHNQNTMHAKNMAAVSVNSHFTAMIPNLISRNYSS